MFLMKYAWLLVFLWLVGCKQKTEQQQLVDAINNPDNKIIQRIKAGNMMVTAKWVPQQYRNLQAMASAIDSSPRDNFYYFNLRFDQLNKETLDASKMSYLNFDLQKDFTLTVGKDSLQPAICQKIERGTSSSYEYLMAFENKLLNNQDFTLVYKDSVFGIGALAFYFNMNEIQKHLSLKK